MGKLVVLEGLDGSGKSTQLELLEQALWAENKAFQTVSFPEYDLPSCAPVKMYLAGEFGTHPGDVNAYAASLFYAVDRFASYKKKWASFYENGGLILAGRYVTSNAIHQASKLPEQEWDGYLTWLYDLEYQRVGIPKPDAVIYLKVPVAISQGLLSGRYQGDEAKKDIHERDLEYLKRCHKAADYAAALWGWRIVECCRDGAMRSKEEIAAEIRQILQTVLADGTDRA